MKFSRYGLRLQAQRSNESPSGAFKRQNGLAQQDGGASPREVSRKENTAYAVQAKDLSGETAAK